VRQGLKFLGAGHEVGLAVHLDKGSHATVHVHVVTGQSLLLEKLHGLVKVAVGFLQCVFAIKNARAGNRS